MASQVKLPAADAGYFSACMCDECVVLGQSVSSEPKIQLPHQGYNPRVPS